MYATTNAVDGFHASPYELYGELCIDGILKHEIAIYDDLVYGGVPVEHEEDKLIGCILTRTFNEISKIERDYPLGEHTMRCRFFANGVHRQLIATLTPTKVK